jgi:hypothetical protein
MLRFPSFPHQNERHSTSKENGRPNDGSTNDQTDDSTSKENGRDRPRWPKGSRIAVNTRFQNGYSFRENCRFGKATV